MTFPYTRASGARWGGWETGPQQGERVVLRYEYLGRTQGLGTFHFGEQTVKDMGLLLAQSEFGQRVNSVFGEGANPRLRKIRDALDLLDLPTEELLHHGGPRLVYGVRLVENARPDRNDE